MHGWHSADMAELDSRAVERVEAIARNVTDRAVNPSSNLLTCDCSR